MKEEWNVKFFRTFEVRHGEFRSPFTLLQVTTPTKPPFRVRLFAWISGGSVSVTRTTPEGE